MPAQKVKSRCLPEKTRVVIADTVKGKGIACMENKREWHSKIPGDDEFEIMYQQLGLTREAFDRI